MLVQPLPGDFAVVEPMLGCADGLMFFVPFTRDQHAISGNSLIESPGNRIGAVSFHHNGVKRRETAENITANFGRILAPRIVVGHDSDVSVRLDGFCHEWPLFAITFTAGAEDTDQPSWGQGPQ